jgi:pilus assembly protein Flp/PilA
MSAILKKMLRKLKQRSGQNLMDYGLILALIGIVTVLVLHGIGSKVNNSLSSVNTGFP